MKILIAATGLALASLAVPQIVAAQQDGSPSSITVTAENQRDWDRGNALEAKGLKELQEAKRNLVRNAAAVVTAQETRDTSRNRAENAREAFESLTARPFFSDPEKARRWAEQVQGTAKDWEKFTKRGDEAESDYLRAQRRQQRAQEQVDKAQLKVDEARAIMAAARRASAAPGVR